MSKPTKAAKSTEFPKPRDGDNWISYLARAMKASDAAPEFIPALAQTAWNVKLEADRLAARSRRVRAIHKFADGDKSLTACGQATDRASATWTDEYTCTACGQQKEHGKNAMAAKVERSMEFSKSFPKSVCACGHTGDGANSYHTDNALVAGHGQCQLCGCRKFTWAEHSEHFRTFLKGDK